MVHHAPRSALPDRNVQRIQRPNAASPVHWDAQVVEGGRAVAAAHRRCGGGGCRPARRRAPVDLARPGRVDPPRHHRRGPRPRPALLGAALPGPLRCGRRSGRRARGADGRRPRQPLLDRQLRPPGAPLPPRPTRAGLRGQGLYYCANPHLVDDRGPGGAERRLLLGWVLGARSPVETVPYWIARTAFRATCSRKAGWDGLRVAVARHLVNRTSLLSRAVRKQRDGEEPIGA